MKIIFSKYIPVLHLFHFLLYSTFFYFFFQRSDSPGEISRGIFLLWGLIVVISLFFSLFHLSKEAHSLKNLLQRYEDPDDTKNKIALIGKMSVAVVHDLKNPMSTIQTLVEMANTDEITKEERIRNLNLIHREINRLSDMAYEILDFVREKLILNLETILLSEFIEEVYRFLEIDFEYADVKFILDLQYGGKITLDSEKVRRVIVNLAKNALEAMYDKKKQYSFTVHSERIGSRLHLSFEDNGPGLPASIQERIFQTFATEGKANGTGIGLYMAKWTMDTHGGEITYKTESGKGTTFTLIFPMEEIV